LENIEKISSLNLNDSIIFNFYDSIDSNEIKRFQIFMPLLIDFKSIKSSQIVMIESVMLNPKRFYRNFISTTDKIAIKSFRDSVEILCKKLNILERIE
jgi:tyrosyl-tRNA synthetase